MEKCKRIVAAFVGIALKTSKKLIIFMKKVCKKFEKTVDKPILI